MITRVCLTTLLCLCVAGCNLDYNENDTTCIRGVEYYRTGHQLAPAFKPDGTLYTCEKGK
jgi:hypothetical protein